MIPSKLSVHSQSAKSIMIETCPNYPVKPIDQWF